MRVVRRGAATLLVIALAGGLAGGLAEGANAQGIDELARSEISASRPGLAVALRHGGELQFLDSYGESGSAPGDPLEADDLFAYPALSEVLLGATIEALHANGVVDRDAALSTYLPEVTPGIGRITLRQLLTHTAGLDDADRVDGETWEKTLDRIDDRALVAEPGLFYSRSRHSLPLAGRVLSTVLRRSFVEIATAAILEPLELRGSTFDIEEARALGLVTGVVRNNDASDPIRHVEAVDTLNGLPVLFTTATDAVTFLSAWNEGRLVGRAPNEVASARNPTSDADRHFGGGVWVDEYRGLTRVSRVATQLGISTAFYLTPETGSTVFIWSRGYTSSGVARFLVDAVADAVGADPSEPSRPERAQPPEPGPPPEPARWAGTYRNGHLIFVLRESEGRLVLFDGSRELELETHDGSRVVARLPDGRIAVRLDLLEDGSGRRYLYFGSLVYRHEADELG